MLDHTEDPATNLIHQAMDDYLARTDFGKMVVEKGQIVTGNVVRRKKGELLISIGGKFEGVVGGAELTSEDIDVDALKIGDEVMVYVVNPSDDKGQLVLSIRKTGTARKWLKLREAKKTNDIIEVEVMESNNGGVIVDTGGLRGFVPTSQLDSSRIFKKGEYSAKGEVMQTVQSKLAALVGEKVKVRIIEIDREKNRVILSEKLVTQEQDILKREETLKKAKIGTVLTGNVTSVTPFGLFVNAEGLDGLVHISEISWDKVTNPAEFHDVGDKVKVQIIGLEDGGKRVAYSIKRLQKDPWSDVASMYKVGEVVTGTVQKIVDYGAFVRIDQGLNGLVHISELSDELILDPREVLTAGQEVDLMILSISPNERHLGLSLKRVKKKEKAERVEKKAEVKDVVEEMNPRVKPEDDKNKDVAEEPTAQDDTVEDKEEVKVEEKTEEK